MTCQPNGAQSVVPGGLRAHTRETASPSPRGGGGPCRKWSRRSASPPNPCPWGVPAACKAVVRARCASTLCRAAAMMLSRTGRDRDPPLGRGQTGEGRRAPWGCAAGAPYRGTASPPPPPCTLFLCVEMVRSTVSGKVKTSPCPITNTVACR